MRVLDWFFAARPLLMIPVWSIFLIALHYHHRLVGQRFDLSDASVLFGLTLLAAGGFYLNQVTDIESDRINGKCLFLPQGLFQPKEFSTAFVVTSIVAIGMGAILSPVTLFIFAQLFVLMYVYSAAPFRWKDRPVGGLFVNAYACGVLVAASVMPEFNLHNVGLLGWDNPFYFGFAVAGTYLLTTVPDLAGDKAMGKQTLSVILGRGGTIVAAGIFFFLAAYVAVGSGYLILGGIAAGAMVLALLALAISADAILMVAIKLPILALAILAGWFYPAYLAFLVVLLFTARVYYQKRFGIIYPRLAA